MDLKKSYTWFIARIRVFCSIDDNETWSRACTNLCARKNIIVSSYRMRKSHVILDSTGYSSINCNVYICGARLCVCACAKFLFWNVPCLQSIMVTAVKQWIPSVRINLMFSFRILFPGLCCILYFKKDMHLLFTFYFSHIHCYISCIKTCMWVRADKRPDFCCRPRNLLLVVSSSKNNHVDVFSVAIDFIKIMG